MKNKNYHYLSILAGIIIILTQVFDYWSTQRYGTKFSASKAISMTLVGISFMIPLPMDLPKLPPAYIVRLLFVMFALLLLGYSFGEV